MNSNHTRLVFLAVASMALAGCEAVHFANVVTMAVTFGLFFGTLSLGRRSSPIASIASATTSSSPRTVERPAAHKVRSK